MREYKKSILKGNGGGCSLSGQGFVKVVDRVKIRSKPIIMNISTMFILKSNLFIA